MKAIFRIIFNTAYLEVYLKYLIVQISSNYIIKNEFQI